MRKTKIICTLGPSTDDDDILRKLPRISNKQSSSDVSSYMDSDD